MSAVTAVGRIDYDASPVGAKTRVRVAAPFSRILLRRMEITQRYRFAGGRVIEIDILISLFVRVDVVQYPLAARQVRAMAVLCHDTLADDLHVFRAVLVQVECVALRRVPCPGEDMFGIAPDKMRRLAVRIDHANITAVGSGGEHPRAETSQARGAPAMEEDESRSVGIE